MSGPYEPKPSPRFVVETTAAGEQIRIGAARPIFVGLIIAVWLCGWTFGGISVIHTLMSKGFQPFLAIWLCGWALGEGFVLLSLAWMVGGCEIIRIAGGDLEIRAELFGFTKTKLYRGDDIRGLGAYAVPFVGRGRGLSLPLFVANRSGAVKFSYGARTIFIAPNLDETEGRLIVDRLLQHLPSAAR
jgi:hypothetical protein